MRRKGSTCGLALTSIGLRMWYAIQSSGPDSNSPYSGLIWLLTASRRELDILSLHGPCTASCYRPHLFSLRWWSTRPEASSYEGERALRVRRALKVEMRCYTKRSNLIGRYMTFILWFSRLSRPYLVHLLSHMCESSTVYASGGNNTPSWLLPIGTLLFP